MRSAFRWWLLVGLFGLLGIARAQTPTPTFVPPPTLGPTDFGLPADATEELGKRNEQTRTFQLSTGEHVAVGFPAPQHVLTGGQWMEPSRQLHEIAGGEFETDPQVSGVRTRLASDGIQLTDASGAGFRWLIGAFALGAQGTTATRTFGGLTWTITVTAEGFDLRSSPVAASQGAFTVRANLNKYGLTDATIGADGNLIAGTLRFTRPQMLGANGIVYPCAWALEANGNRLAMTCDDRTLPPEAYPYIIDPSAGPNAPTTCSDGGTTTQGGCSITTGLALTNPT